MLEKGWKRAFSLILQVPERPENPRRHGPAQRLKIIALIAPVLLVLGGAKSRFTVKTGESGTTPGPPGFVQARLIMPPRSRPAKI